MKRSLICFLLAVALCVSGAAYAAVALNDRADQVTYTETVLLGDPSIVEGVTVTADISLMSQLFWTTEHTLGREPEIAVDYTYYPERQSSELPPRYDGLYLSNDFDYDIDEESDPSELSGLTLAFRELYESGSGGKDRTEKTIRLRDYYELYPIGARIQLPGTSYIYWGSDFRSEPPLEEMDENGVITLEDGSVIQMGPEALTIRAFQEFFKIPVPEDQYVKIHMDWQGDKPTYYGFSDMSFEESDWFSISTLSAWNDTACYFTFDPRTHLEKLVDTSHIPGGYGIYRLPLYPDHGDNELGYDGRELSMVYPLDPAVPVTGLYTNRDGKDLLLFTIEEDTAMLTVIDTDTMETRQRIELLRGEGLYVDSVEIPEDFMTFRISKSEPAPAPEGVEDADYREWTEYVSVLTWDESGEYTMEFMVESEQTANDGVTVLDRPSNPELDWNGEELVMCGHHFDYTYAYGSSTCGYVVAVYDETGMTYYAEYDSSLHTGNTTRACNRGGAVVSWP